MRRKLIALAAAMAMVLGLMGGVAGANGFEYISTNDENREADLPHVNVVELGQDWIEFDFVNPTNWLFAFEYRVDGEETPYPGSVHPITGGDWYHVVNLDGREDQHLVNMTINANEKVEVRLALGAENDYYFDWTTFYVEPATEYEAAPAVAARLLDDAGVDNRYGQGRTGGNFIADVARHMEDTTDFDGVSKEDVIAYEYAVAAFLNNPANGEFYPAGVSCPCEGVLDPEASGAIATDNADGTVTLQIAVLDLCGNGISGLDPLSDFSVTDSVISGTFYFGTGSIPGSSEWDEEDGVYTVTLERNFFNARPAGYDDGWYRIWSIYVQDELVEAELEISTTYWAAGDWKMDLSGGHERFIIIETHVDGEIDGFFGVGYDPGGDPTGTIEGTIVGRDIYMLYDRTDIETDYTAEFWGTITDDGNSMSGTWTSGTWYMERQ